MKRNTRRRWIAFVSLFALASCQSEDPTDQNPQPDNSQVEPSGQKPSVQDPNPDPTPQEPSPGGDASTSAGESGSNGSTTTGGDSGGSTSSDPGTEDSSEDETDSSDDGKIDCASLKVTGSNIGQVPMNLELINAKGDKVSLHEHCNDVLYIAAATAYWANWGYQASAGSVDTQSKHQEDERFYWDWDDGLADSLSKMLKSYPDGGVKVFFLLHTNKQNAPAKTAADAAIWDKRLKLANQPFASTLADAERKGLTEYFGDNKKGNVVLKRGFEVHAIDVEDFAKAVKEAVDAG